MHGYELKKRLSFMLGHFWTVSYGSLYPALKRLDKANDIEKAYSIKEKTRNRNVYRITGVGEREFMRLLADTSGASTLADSEKFDIRMAFFQYLEPETRLKLLEKRRKLLEDQVAKFKAYRSSNRNQDRYQSGLLRHNVEQTKSDIRWLERLITQEREAIEKRDSEAERPRERSTKAEQGQITAASGA